MKVGLTGSRGLIIVAALCVTQLVVLSFSLGPLLSASIFCTGPNASSIAVLFGVIHLCLLALLGIGVLSIRFEILRLPYAVLLLIGLSALPFQAHLVSTGRLQCDFP
jgi:hypothetical protein